MGQRPFREDPIRGQTRPAVRENTFFHGWPPIAVALASQVFSLVPSLTGVSILVIGSGEPASLYVTLIVNGLIAAVIGHLLGLAIWWAPIQLLFLPMLALAYQVDLPAWSFLVVFGGLALVFWNTGGERVPLYLTNAKTCEAISGLIGEDTKAFLDLGSGTGSTLFYLALHRPDTVFHGIESAPGTYALSRLRLALSGLSNLKLAYGDIWSADLGDYDVVYAFLSPAPMTKLFDKVIKEMKPGGLFISNSFAVPGREPDEILQVDDKRATQLLIWHS